MAETPSKKRRSLDVWIVESKTVYKEVPYTVVIDWVQQGRLLEDDQIRATGTEKWHRLADVPAVATYLPRADKYRVDDEAEALEAVHSDFGWRRPGDDEDDDVDMIPLIDVSLVLLIFFMMTATVTGAGSLIQMPKSPAGFVTADDKIPWVGIEPGKDGATAAFSLGQGTKTLLGADQKAVLARLDQLLEELPGPVDVHIRADKTLTSGVVRALATELEKRRAGEKKPKGIHDIHSGIRGADEEKKP